MMGKPQEAHLARVKEQVVAALDAKYRAGQAEHGGYLLDIGVTALLDAAIDEAIDQATYLLSLRELLVGTRSERREMPTYVQDINTGEITLLEKGR